MPSHNFSHSRRSFLKKAIKFGGITFLPSYIALGQKRNGGQASPNDKLRVAAIGIGNQGNANIKSLENTGLCDLVALCDVDLQGKHCAETLAKYPQLPRFTDFRQMFDRMAEQIDAVLIATPDHSHFAASMLAMSLGKPIYVQKPLAHNFGQCQRLMEMATRSGVVTQMGNQGHSSANFYQFKAWTEAGLIKNVSRITAHMNRSRRWHGWGSSVKGYPEETVPKGMAWDQWIDGAPEHPFSKRLHPANWRSWFDYGSGAFGDWGPHILDTAHRFLELGLPEKITPLKRLGANPWVFPQASTIRFSFPARKQHPPCEVTWYDGIDNHPKVERELGDFQQDAEGNEVFQAVSTDNPGKIIYAEDHTFQGGSHSSILRILPRSKFMQMRRELPRFETKCSDHFTNFLLACRGEEEARSPFSVAAPLTQVFNLGIIAQRLGTELLFDRTKNTITNDAGARALLDPAPRRGWEEFYQL